jgi:hypothetical protein
MATTKRSRTPPQPHMQRVTRETNNEPHPATLPLPSQTRPATRVDSITTVMIEANHLTKLAQAAFPEMRGGELAPTALHSNPRLSVS